MNEIILIASWIITAFYITKLPVGDMIGASIGLGIVLNFAIRAVF